VRAQQINRVSGKVAILLSLIALLCVASGYFGPPQPCAQDEGSAAHIFQISIVALAPTILVFLATADWKQPWRSARPLAVPAAALLLAFGTLYYVEHYQCSAAQPRVSPATPPSGAAKNFALILYE